MDLIQRLKATFDALDRDNFGYVYIDDLDADWCHQECGAKLNEILLHLQDKSRHLGGRITFAQICECVSTLCEQSTSNTANQDQKVTTQIFLNSTAKTLPLNDDIHGNSLRVFSKGITGTSQSQPPSPPARKKSSHAREGTPIELSRFRTQMLSEGRQLSSPSDQKSVEVRLPPSYESYMRYRQHTNSTISSEFSSDLKPRNVDSPTVFSIISQDRASRSGMPNRISYANASFLVNTSKSSQCPSVRSSSTTIYQNCANLSVKRTGSVQSGCETPIPILSVNSHLPSSVKSSHHSPSSSLVVTNNEFPTSISNHIENRCFPHVSVIQEDQESLDSVIKKPNILEHTNPLSDKKEKLPRSMTKTTSRRTSESSGTYAALHSSSTTPTQFEAGIVAVPEEGSSFIRRLHAERRFLKECIRHLEKCRSHLQCRLDQLNEYLSSPDAFLPHTSANGKDSCPSPQVAPRTLQSEYVDASPTPARRGMMARSLHDGLLCHQTHEKSSNDKKHPVKESKHKESTDAVSCGFRNPPFPILSRDQVDQLQKRVRLACHTLITVYSSLNDPNSIRLCEEAVKELTARELLESRIETLTQEVENLRSCSSRLEVEKFYLLQTLSRYSPDGMEKTALLSDSGATSCFTGGNSSTMMMPYSPLLPFRTTWDYEDRSSPSMLTMTDI